MTSLAGIGEEFRDDERRRVGLPPDVVKRLTRIDPLRAWLGVLETVGLIGLSIAAALYWWTPWAVIPAMIVIAGRQQACFVLAHDAEVLDPVVVAPLHEVLQNRLLLRLPLPSAPAASSRRPRACAARSAPRPAPRSCAHTRACCHRACCHRCTETAPSVGGCRSWRR